MANKIEFYSVSGCYSLRHADRDSAIEASLRDSNEWPAKIAVCSYAKKEIPDISESILDELLEKLDEDYRYNKGITKPTGNMLKASSLFFREIIKEYGADAYTLVKREAVDVHTWVEKNKPEWID